MSYFTERHYEQFLTCTHINLIIKYYEKYNVIQLSRSKETYLLNTGNDFFSSADYGYAFHWSYLFYTFYEIHRIISVGFCRFHKDIKTNSLLCRRYRCQAHEMLKAYIYIYMYLKTLEKCLFLFDNLKL